MSYLKEKLQGNIQIKNIAKNWWNLLLNWTNIAIVSLSNDTKNYDMPTCEAA